MLGARGQPRVNYLTHTVEEKDRRIAKLQAELMSLRSAKQRLLAVLSSRLKPGETLGAFCLLWLRHLAVAGPAHHATVALGSQDHCWGCLLVSPLATPGSTSAPVPVPVPVLGPAPGPVSTRAPLVAVPGRAPPMGT